MKKVFYLFFALLLVSISYASTSNGLAKSRIDKEADFKISIPLAGNAYSSLRLDRNRTISNNGIENWSNPEEYFTVYFRVSKPGKFQVAIEDLGLISGKSELEFSINNVSKTIKLDASSSKKTISVGNWKIDKEGYVALVIKGTNKTEKNFPARNRLAISSAEFDGKIAYVPNNEGGFYHWGRRGASVHMNYQAPENVNAEWYYNELTVPVGEDKIGSYFMANGFGEGYFGIQVNSAKERRVLFSVWSPFTTDDPKSIPESHKIKLLKKGENVTTGEFGNEGSGGQSYLKYNWIAGNTYKFLLRGKPEGNNSTNYTAYFFAPETGEWKLIASFNRPQTNTYLKRFHSFLENFVPEQGDFSRKVVFNNQWYCDEKGNWQELNTAKFSADDTARRGYRMDYSGGVNGDGFYLKNGGFYNEYTSPGALFTRPFTNNKPVINFNSLP